MFNWILFITRPLSVQLTDKQNGKLAIVYAEPSPVRLYLSSMLSLFPCANCSNNVDMLHSAICTSDWSLFQSKFPLSLLQQNNLLIGD